MSEIPIHDADGSSGQPDCRTHRQRLVTRYEYDTIIALRYFTDDTMFAEADKPTDVAAIAHVRTCQKCQAWFRHAISQDVRRRQSRLSQYCCPSMFVAVEECEEHPETRINFEMYEDSKPCWKIGSVYSFLYFCPWCGQELPDEPFIEDA